VTEISWSCCNAENKPIISSNAFEEHPKLMKNASRWVPKMFEAIRLHVPKFPPSSYLANVKSTIRESDKSHISVRVSMMISQWIILTGTLFSLSVPDGGDLGIALGIFMPAVWWWSADGQLQLRLPLLTRGFWRQLSGLDWRATPPFRWAFVINQYVGATAIEPIPLLPGCLAISCTIFDALAHVVGARILFHFTVVSQTLCQAPEHINKRRKNTIQLNFYFSLSGRRACECQQNICM